MPPIKPKMMMINGSKVELFYINALANALGRQSQTIRKWEIAGVIPTTCFKDKSNRRMYSQEQIDAIVEVAEECKITQGASIANTSFASRVAKRLEEVNRKYLAKKV